MPKISSISYLECWHSVWESSQQLTFCFYLLLIGKRGFFYLACRSQFRGLGNTLWTEEAKARHLLCCSDLQLQRQIPAILQVDYWLAFVNSQGFFFNSDFKSIILYLLPILMFSLHHGGGLIQGWSSDWRLVPDCHFYLSLWKIRLVTGAMI